MRYLATALLLFLAGLIQSTDFLSVAGIKPNWLLAAMILLAIIGRPLMEYVMWSLLAAILLRFSPEPLLWHQIVFLLTAMGVFMLNRFLPWSRYINLVVIVAIGTIIFYLLLSPNFLYQQWAIPLGEIVYNLIIAGVLMYIWPTKILT